MPDETTGETTGGQQLTPAAESTAPTGGTATEGQQAPEGAEAPAPAKKAARKAPAKKATAKKAPAKKAAATDDALPLEGDAAPAAADTADAAADAPAPAKKAAKKAPAKKAAAKKSSAKKAAEPEPEPDASIDAADAAPAEKAEQADKPAKPAKKTAAKKSTAKKSTAKKAAAEPVAEPGDEAGDGAGGSEVASAPEAAAPSRAPLFQAPVAAKKTSKPKKKAAAAPVDEDPSAETVEDEDAEETEATDEQATEDADGATDAEDGDESDDTEDGEEGGSPARRRRRRGGRRRRRGGSGGSGGGDASSDSDDEDGSADAGDSGNPDATGGDASDGDAEGDADDSDAGEGQGEGSGSSRRRRRRRRSGEGGGGDDSDDPANTVTRVRSSRTGEDQITALSGSTRLEAKKQRRREGREAGRRRAPIVSEAEFLARRESVERVMVIREREDLTQIGVLEDKVLVEHYVARESQTSLIGNVYLGRVQNVLPSMEAAFIDIGKGRNAVLYAGEVNWSALGHKDGQPRKIESVLSSGQSVLVQVTKDPIGHKGARLTSQISLAGRFLVYVPDGTTSGISRKLPDTERSRLKALLKELVPDTAGVIVRTAAEGASEDELTRDVERLKARWEDIEKKAKGSAPQLLYGEPDLTLKVVRDLFTEDFAKLVIQGDDAWETVQSYVTHVAPDLADRLERFEPATEGKDAGKDLFAAYRVDEQIAKGLDRKVWLPSGGSLVIDRTEAMTVVDVNTGKFTGSGGNLEETVTKNNLEAAEEVVRQLRLRDIGGIIVVDFIDMVLESNRDLVLRRLVECLGRDRTRHQVAEVTSLGLVQMTRKRIGTGLLEAFSESCTHCQGRGLVIHDHPVEQRGGGSDDDRGGSGGGSKRSRGGRGKGEGQSGGSGSGSGASAPSGPPSPKDIAAMPRHEKADEPAAPAEATGSTEATGATTGEQPAADAAGTSSDQGRQTSSGRGSRGNRSRKPGAEPGDEPTDGTTAEPTPEPAAEQASEPTAEPTVEATPEPEAPATEPEARPEPVADKPAEKPAGSSGVVTRTRRAARRTGPLTTGEGAAVVVEAPSAPAAAEQPAESAASAPKVVTRTRSSRTARPASATGSAAAPATEVPSMEQADAPGGIGQPATTGLVEPGTADTEPALASGAAADEGSAPSTVEHVPVKRKGSRKR